MNPLSYATAFSETLEAAATLSKFLKARFRQSQRLQPILAVG
jgi:hypothetical protein